MFWGRYWYIVVASVITTVVPSECLSNRAEPWMPEATHYAASAQGRDCGSLRYIAVQAQRKIAEIERLVEAQVEELKNRRRILEACAISKGLRPTTDEDETIIAEMCPAAYESWLSPSYRVHMFREDIRSAGEALSGVRTNLKNRCGALPGGVMQANY